MVSIQQVKQTIYAEMLEVDHNAKLGKYNDLHICKHRAQGHIAYWEIQIILRDKLDSIGHLEEALKELIDENKIEKTKTKMYKIKE